MATSYALPTTAMHNAHNHHGHNHVHSHSQTSSRPAANTRSTRHERSNGHLHSSSSSSFSDTTVEHNPIHDHKHKHGSSCNHSHHSHDPSPLGLGYPTPPNSDSLPGQHFEKHTHEASLELSKVDSYEPPSNAVNVVGHNQGHHHHHSSPSVEPRSKFTTFILPYTRKWPLLYTIMAEKDSRRIFYFMSLNFGFMLIQAFYGFVTDSLGLLSDSIHMLFDCLALGVGLFAAVASKWPPSERFPYGFGKIESLSGFGNGVFLMLISVEIMIEAVERLAEDRPTKRLLELFVVSGLGLAVNLIGMACFGHHHHGHDHGHSHGHSHEHSHDHSHSHSHDEKHDCDHAHDHHSHEHSHDHAHQHSHDHSHDSLLSEKPKKGHSHAHSHDHDNENMHGIFLHVLADTMGSAAVMVSTALIYFTGFQGWDPIASCVIAILIFLSSIPLIKSSARKLLLTVPDDTEYALRDTLASVSGLRGVASYTVPRFWLGDGIEGEGERVLGVMHVQATRGSDLDDVKERVRVLLLERGMNVVVQVEGIGETGCWCGGMRELNFRRGISSST